VIYSWDLTTPANTPEDAPKEWVLKMAYGVIHQVNIIFPAGCAGLAHIKIFRGANQVWPSNLEGDFAGGDEVISFREFFPLETEPFQLEAITWNEDDTYDHTIIVRLGLLRREYLGAFPPKKRRVGIFRWR